MRKYQYIFWDMDGTIINSYQGVTSCVQYALEHFGIRIEEESQLRKFIGPPLRKSFSEICGLTPEQAEEAVALYRERYIPVGVYECELFPGVRETMEAFGKAGYMQVIASSKPEPQCRSILDKFSLTGLLDEIVGASLDGKIDTKIQVLNEAFRRIKDRDPLFSRDRAVLIGDTHFDVDGAKEAGIDCIGVSYGFGTREELESHGAVAVYPDLGTLMHSLDMDD